ncbi:alpha/beta hydrolase [Rossellomorea aquimaris]|uniref:alpha/beta hydrolase n=1 Tax=Rossellomorea aquimaris TaxID=189382 RepID=UPI0007D05692|nr:alpha/beta hydrolase-fold protein [Rossellomorea aquimaris]
MYEHFEVKITPLNRKRLVRVYLPNDYQQETKTYPVLYMHDGQNLYKNEDAGYGMSWKIGEYLDKSNLDLIVVGIDCNEGLYRLDEYGPWQSKEMTDIFSADRHTIGGEGKVYIDYIVHELKPLVDQKYRTNPEETSMAGSSMGGLISTYAACIYPDTFKRIASVSPAYWFNQENIEELINLSDLSQIERFYMDIGSNEATDSIDCQKYIESSRKVYHLLKEKIDNCKFEIVKDAEHNEIAWSKRVPQIFSYLYK